MPSGIKINELPRAAQVSGSNLIAVESPAGTGTEAATVEQLRDYVAHDALEAISEAAGDAVEAVEEKGAETLASIPEDYTKITGDVADLKSALYNYNSTNLLINETPADRDYRGVHYRWNSDGSCNVTTDEGGATTFSFCNIIVSQNTMPTYLTPGSTYYLQFNAVNVHVNFIWYLNNSTSIERNYTGDGLITIPSNAIGVIMRITVQSGVSANELITIALLTAPSNNDLLLYATEYQLLSTGDRTDRTNAIEQMLTARGVCRLSPGVFWVNGVNMPDDSAIIGSGPNTKIYLLGDDNTSGYAIKMGSRCTVRDVTILGNTTDYTTQSNAYPSSMQKVERHGILWEGNYSTTSMHTSRRGLISGCNIANFTGGAITLRDTGPNVISGISISDCIIWHCYTGVNIEFYSEYNRISNVAASNCHYGCIDNGGNNIFSNCVFSLNIVGFMIDNSDGTMTNNSHGSVSNCIINHSDNNTGNAIILRGVSFGEIFTGCQIFFGKIIIDNSKGVNFVGLNAGSGETIEISGGEKILFANCIFRTTPTVNISNNSLVTFSNCYTYDGTLVG